jgi:P2X purinoceptor 4
MSSGQSSWGVYLRKTVSLFFEYDTPRYVHINSKRVGVFSRIIQLILIGYIVGFVLVYKKGYQDTCDVESTIVTKVKGVSYTNYTDQELNVPSNPDLYRRNWDASDYVVPASSNEHGGLFIMTTIVITPNQTRGTCPEDPNIEGSVCKSSDDCHLGYASEIGNGVQTGKCVPSERLSDVKTCEIHAWCPVEQDVLPLNGTKPLLEDARNFTILVKNAISFPDFGPQFQRRNVLEDANATYLQNCIYHRHSDPFCPIFRLEDIIAEAGEDFLEVGKKGAVFRITITWNCNLDWNFMGFCRPNYSFQRMDNPAALISPGFNFRLARYHEEDRRTLSKMYGIKLLIDVNGVAGKFNVVPLLLNVGSGLALMGLATVICDLAVLYCHKNRIIYKTKKYLTVRGHDAFDINPGQAATDHRTYARLSVDQGSTDNDEGRGAPTDSNSNPSTT